MSERPRWLALYERWQFDTNCLASVAIEIPALRPILAARLRGVDASTAAKDARASGLSEQRERPEISGPVSTETRKDTGSPDPLKGETAA